MWVSNGNSIGQTSMRGLQVFQPYVCNMRDWDQEDFLKCTYKRRIIMIGDMSMHQMFNSMACLLSASVQEGSQVPWEVSIPPSLQRWKANWTLGHSPHWAQGECPAGALDMQSHDLH